MQQKLAAGEHQGADSRKDRKERTDQGQQKVQIAADKLQKLAQTAPSARQTLAGLAVLTLSQQSRASMATGNSLTRRGMVGPRLATPRNHGPDPWRRGKWPLQEAQLFWAALKAAQLEDTLLGVMIRYLRREAFPRFLPVVGKVPFQACIRILSSFGWDAFKVHFSTGSVCFLCA